MQATTSLSSLHKNVKFMHHTSLALSQITMFETSIPTALNLWLSACSLLALSGHYAIGYDCRETEIGMPVEFPVYLLSV